jgi:hypothetical protein
LLATTQWIEFHVNERRAVGGDIFRGRIVIPLTQIKAPYDAAWFKLLPKAVKRDADDDAKVTGELHLKLVLTKRKTGEVLEGIEHN